MYSSREGRIKKLFRFCLAMNEIDNIIGVIRKFNEERDWSQFHNAKDLAISISIEANELLECFLWKNSEDANVEKVKEELADILIYAFMLADKFDFDIDDIIKKKIGLNAIKYPVEKAKGKALKYNEF